MIETIETFVANITRTLEKNGYPGKRVALPLERMYEVAHEKGLNFNKALEVLQSGPAFSRVMETKGRKMILGDFEPQARLSQHLKDVRLILAEASKTGAKTPLSELHERLLTEIEAAGHGPEDNAAIVRAFHRGGA